MPLYNVTIPRPYRGKSIPPPVSMKLLYALARANPDREVPRYQRRVFEINPERVITKVAGMYGVAEGLMARPLRTRLRRIWESITRR